MVLHKQEAVQDAGNPFGQHGIPVLVEHGADVNSRDDEGKTPLDYATAKDFKENVEVLKILGAS